MQKRMPNQQCHRTGRRGCFTIALWGCPLLHSLNLNSVARSGARGVSREMKNGLGYLLLLLILFALSACGTPKPTMINSIPIDEPSNRPPSQGELEWFNDVLARMQEPPIISAAGRQPSRAGLRLLIIPTFRPPETVRIEKTGESYELHYKLLSGAGGYNPGNLTASSSRSISADAWRSINEQALSESLLQLPRRNIGCVFDGDMWILESYHGQEHAIFTYACPQPGIYRSLCDSLLVLAGSTQPHPEKW